MASVQDRNKLKRVSYDTWSTREQLCLASSVLKLGDQNMAGVSRSLKPFAEKEALRPPDWFTPKSCAMQYANLLENAEVPKRKKKDSGVSMADSIVKRLTQERIAELGQILAFQRDEYQQLKAEVNMLRSGAITEEKLQRMWLAIEQEEREQEQKARVHAAWLAKRQQKQEAQSSQNLGTPRKNLEATCENQEAMESTNDEEEKKNRGGRSPLLTSLLKSPSPTTQMQNPGSTAQVNSPTIASLLGSSPKIPNPPIASTITPQLHQLVTNAMNTSSNERPSVGAPTLSMLLELPANLQRGSLASLQQAAANAQQQTADMQTTGQTMKLSSSVNAGASILGANIASTSSAPNESMVQIIDPIDDVINKEIMTDAINKDEINEIIGDLEELIKEEITPSAEIISTKVTPSPSVIERDSPVQEVERIQPERPEPRDVDEPVSQSNSPQSEMAIEDIDQSTSSIAEIIGTAIEQPEMKITVEPVREETPKVEEKEVEKEETKEEEKIEEETIETKSTILDDEKEKMEEKVVAVEEIPEVEKVEKVEEKVQDAKEEISTPEVESKTPEPVETMETAKMADKESEETPAEPIVAETEETAENSVEPKEKLDETKTDVELDQIEMNLAKITGDQMEASSADVASVCSEVTTDPPSMDENEKSEDISMILEDDESSRNSSIKKKDNDDNSLIDNTVECSDSQESFKEDSSSKDETKEPTNVERSSDVECSPIAEIVEEEKNEDEETMRVEESKESEDEASLETTENEKKEEKIVDTTITEIEETNETEKSGREVTEEKIEKEERKEKPEKEETEEKEDYEKKEEKVDKVDKEDKEDKVDKEDKEDKVDKQDKVDNEEDEQEKEENEDKEETEENDEKEENEEKDEKGEMEEKEEKEGEDSLKLEMDDSEDEKCGSPMAKDEKTEIKDEPEMESSMEQLDEPKKEESEIIEDKDDDGKMDDCELSVKKEIGESAGSVCDDMADLDEEESSLSKLSGGRAMKTYSKKQAIAIDSEPENESSGENADYRAWKKAVMLAYNRLATHKYASLFLRPITEDQAPGYHSVIFRPMDLSTIKKNIDNGTIRSTMHFQRDVMLMFQNAIMYNKQDTFVYKMAVSMQEECLQHMQILVEVTGEGQLRRETRTAASSSSETSESSVKRKRSHITPSPHDTDSPRGKKRRKSEND